MPNRPMYRNSYPNNYSYGFQQPALGVWTPAQTPAQYPRRVLSDPPEDFKLPSPLSFREFKLDPEAPAFVPAKEKTPPKNTGNGWLIVG